MLRAPCIAAALVLGCPVDGYGLSPVHRCVRKRDAIGDKVGLWGFVYVPVVNGFDIPASIVDDKFHRVAGGRVGGERWIPSRACAVAPDGVVAAASVLVCLVIIGTPWNTVDSKCVGASAVEIDVHEMICAIGIVCMRVGCSLHKTSTRK